MVDDSECPKAGKHRELEKAEIRKSEEAVQRTMTAIQNFSNPFTSPEKDHLFSLASGAAVPPDVEADVLGAEEAGRNARNAFIIRRFIEGAPEKLFFEPIPRLRLKTMESSNKTVRLNSSQGKVRSYLVLY